MGTFGNKSFLLAMTIIVVSSRHLSAADPQSFFREHCVKCHGAKTQKGELRLDSLAWKPADSENIERWQAIVDRIDAGQMPPEDEPALSTDQRAAIVTSLRKRIADAAASIGRKHVTLRRLNRAQFRNSIRDLLHIDVAVEDPTEAFPADDVEDGFDNLGEVLQMSDFLLRQYLKVARTAVDRATFTGEKPEPETHVLRNKKSRRLNFKSSGNDPDRDDVLLYLNDERSPGDPRGQQLINCREGAPHDGWYEFTFDVESRGRGKFAEELRVQKRDDYQVYRAEDLHRFEVYLTAPAANSQIQTRPRHLVVSLDMPDNERMEIKRRFWLPKGWRVEVGFGNAFSSSANTLLEILDPEFDPDGFAELSNPEQRRESSKRLVDLLHKLDGPRIIIHDVTETGPIYNQCPPLSHAAVYGKPEQSAREHLLEFAKHAFRRPVTQEQIAPYLRLAESSPEGIRTAIEAILCSPRFIYLHEQRVALGDSRHRGGLLGQASVLTASANGVDTSPVVRGIWILENLLGTPPDPPPPNVEVPEPDARGELSIRQLYAKHRTAESCNDCHKKIDPLGFALENFDAIGAWKTKYESGNEVDPSGHMPSGEQFSDVAGLKRIMVRDLDQFSRNLTDKLMTYATGRTMQVTDRPEIDRIVAELNSNQAGLRDLVKLVVTSNIFRTK